MRLLTAYFLSFLLMAGTPPAWSAGEPVPETAKPLKVLFHVSEQDKLDSALGNVENLFKSLGPDEKAEVVMVMNGTAPNRVDASKPQLQSFSQYLKAAYYFVVGLFSSEKPSMPPPALQRIENLSKNHGVEFLVCDNSLKGLKINKANLPAFMKVVPAGVTELARKENEGYAYLKP